MFKLDNEFLTTLGLGGLPVDEKNRLLQMIYERLEMNVGMRLAEKMTDAQLDEFEGFIDRNDEPGALKWLEANFPNYKDVVAEELEKLKVEVKQAAPQIIAAAQSVVNNPQPAMQSGGMPMQPQQYGQQAPYQQPQMGAPAPAQPTAADLMSYQQPQMPPMYQNSAMPPVQPQYSQPYQQQPAPMQPQMPQQPNPVAPSMPTPDLGQAKQGQPAPSSMFASPSQPAPLTPVAPTPQAPSADPYSIQPTPTQQPATPTQPQQNVPTSPQPQNNQFTPPPAGFNPGS